jgi:SAM-dependent methyltransferase
MSAIMKSAVQPHNEKAAATWSAPGDLYDEISRGLAGAIDHCINRLQIRPGSKVLDLACGTGWASRTIASMGKDAQLFGVDIAHGLIESAKRIAKRSNLAVEYEVGDAEQLPYEDSSFDAVISSFGIMFASKPDAASSELTRVVKKGGRFGILVWKPDSTVFEMFKVMKPYLPVAPTPAPSPFAWGSRDRIRELLGAHWELGFEEGVSPFLAPSPEGAWELWTSIYGPTKMLATNLPPDRREQFRRDMLAFHGRFQTELGVFKPREYLLAVGIRK